MLLRERETQWTLGLLTLATIFRFWYCTKIDLVPDEAYYWLWAQHLDASYFSKGPAVAWTIAFGTHLFGNTAFGVRWLSVLLSLGTGWQLYLLARRLFTPQVGFLAVLIVAVTPIFSVGSVLMTIDPLSVFFWTWASNLFLDALTQPQAFRWILVGFAVGSGFLSKYTNAMELLGFALFMGLSAKYRRWLFSWNHLLLLGTFLVCISPVIWWNQHHHWVTAAHLQQGGKLDQPLSFSLLEFWKFFQGQLLPYSPLLFLSMLAAVIALSLRPKSWQVAYLLALFWPIVGMYSLLSFHDAAAPNWTTLAYVGGFILTASYWSELSQRLAWAKNLFRTSLIIGLVMTALFHNSYFLHLHHDPTLRVRGWKEWGQQADVYRQKYQPDYLMSNDYGTASELAFYLPQQTQTYIPETGKIQNQFSYWPSYSHEPGKTVLYITNDPIEKLPGLLPEQFAHAERVGHFERKWLDRKADDYYVWLLTN